MERIQGKWMTEPTESHWVDEDTGLPCFICRRNRLGHWCGYVGIPERHPHWGDDDSSGCIDFVVHGGVTYGQIDPKKDKACGLDKPHWWIGFDCAHSGDMVPEWDRPGSGNIYRDMNYVRDECLRLAKQLAEAGTR